MTRQPSSWQIRQAASRAFRRAMRESIPTRPGPLREPRPGETPLSPAEVAFGLYAGVFTERHPHEHPGH